MSTHLCDDRSARAVWSVIAEPTDAAARLLWLAYGPAAALDLARGTEAALSAALGEARWHEAASELQVSSAEASRARRSPTEVARDALARWGPRLGRDAETIVERSAERGIRLLTPGEPEWPAGLDDLRANAPIALWARGRGLAAPHLGTGVSVAVVGARASTPYGNEIAFEIGAGLAARGATVVSGGAFGIDAAAHRGALGSGATVAVLAGGLDRLYPRGNADLLTQVSEHGVLYSEAPLGATPARWRFLARNRLIAAMSGATVVVEAAWRSGALSTATHADHLSRPVGAVPGSVLSAASGGCHRLIRERGALLITGADDILDMLSTQEVPGSTAGAGTSGSAAALWDDAELLSPADRLVFDGIPPRSAITQRALALECAVSEEEVRAALARIEVLGLAKLNGERVTRAAR